MADGTGRVWAVKLFSNRFFIAIHFLNHLFTYDDG